MTTLYKLTITEEDMMLYKEWVLQNKGDFVAGVLLGKLEQNRGYIIEKESNLKEEDLINPL